MTPLFAKPKVWMEGPWAYTDKDLMGLGIEPGGLGQVASK